MLFIGLARTLIAIVICLLLWAVSGKVFNFLPAILMIPIVIVYYSIAMLVYFVIASDDIISTIIGALISLAFIVLYFMNISGQPVLMKVVHILGLLMGVAQTIKSLSIRLGLRT